MPKRSITIGKLRKRELVALLEATSSALRYAHDKQYTSDRHNCDRVFSIMCEPLIYLTEAVNGDA